MMSSDIEVQQEALAWPSAVLLGLTLQIKIFVIMSSSRKTAVLNAFQSKFVTIILNRA
jgi:hypothetical protein